MLNMKAVKGVNPKSPHHKEKMSFSFIVYLYEMMNVHWTYCGNHFIMYTSQIIRLYTLHTYSSVCQLYLTVKGKKSRNWPTGSKNLYGNRATNSWDTFEEKEQSWEEPHCWISRLVLKLLLLRWWHWHKDRQ